MKNKFKKIVIAFTLVVSIPSSVFASGFTPLGAGSWDTVLSGNFTATSSKSKTPTFTSGGGDLRVCMSGVDPNNNVKLYLRKSNGTLIPPEMAWGNSSSSPSAYYCFSPIDMRPHVGSNGTVDLYLEMHSQIKSSDTVYIKVED